MAMFQILGPVRLLARDRNVDLGSAKVRGLLGILLLYADSAVSVDLIVDRLWDESDESDTGGHSQANHRKTLQSYVSKLRALLRKAAAPAVVRTEHGSYRLEVDPGIVDIHRFRRLCDEGRTATRSGDHIGAIAAFEAAVDLWHGRPLADIQSSWSTRNGESLTMQELLPAHFGLLQAHAALGNHDEVLARLRPLLMTHETHEPFAALRMRALAAVDGPGAVITWFRDYERKVRDLLDTVPSDDLVRLYRELTQQPTARPDRVTRVRQTPQQLPRDIANFIGRADIMRQLDDLLVTPDGQPAVVSLDGGPGVGKTTVATHWAHRRRAHFSDGFLYSDLAGYGPAAPASPAAVLSNFLDALGIAHNDQPSDVTERASLLRRELTGKRILVVLDNARDSSALRPLLAATSPSPVLITSRQKLAYSDGAYSVTIPTLLIDEAIALLQQPIGRARIVNDLPAIHDLAALCSSTPLALRIAGEHVAARPDAPVRDLVRHLRSKHRLLDAGTHGDDESANLRAVIGWSTDALPADADRLFCLLGIHLNTQISTPAAAALVGWSIEHTEQVFDRLVGAHLAHQCGADRYQLHDLLHFFAGDRAENRLTPEERREAVHRQVDWYLATADAAVSKATPQWRSVPPLALTTSVRPEKFDDVQQALTWCVRERGQVLAVVRSAIQHQFHEHVWRLIVTFDEILYRSGDPRDTMDAHLAALDSARVSASRFGEAVIQNNIGAIQFYLGQYENAARSYSQSLSIVREIGDETAEAPCLFNIATTLLERGIYRKAAEYYQMTLSIAKRLDDKDVQARVYHRLGELHQRWEQTVEAERFYQKSLALRVQCNDTRNQSATLARLGELCVGAGDLPNAIEYCERSIGISSGNYDHRTLADALAIRGAAQFKLGLYDESVSSALESVDLCHSAISARGEAKALSVLASARRAMGDVAAADESRAKALALIENYTDPLAVQIRAALNASEGDVHAVPGQRAAAPVNNFTACESTGARPSMNPRPTS